MMSPRHFLITSHGRTATYWLASSLNAHPNVRCSHGQVLPPVLEYQVQPPDEVVLQAHTSQDEFARRSLDDFFDELEKAGPAAVYGNVHAYSAHTLFTHVLRGPVRRNPVVLNVVRHPITRIESLKRRLLHEMTFSPVARRRLEREFEVFVTPDVLATVRANCDVDLGPSENRAFLYAVCFITTLDRMDLEIPVSHLPMERLTKDVDFFAWCFSQVTQGTVRLDTAYLRQVFAAGRMNFQADETSAVGRYEAWAPWMRVAFRAAMAVWELEQLYAPLGYDLSFVHALADRPLVPGSVSFAATPRLVEEGYKGFNLLLYGSQYYALAQDLGPVDLMEVGAEVLAGHEGRGLCARGDSLEEVRGRVDEIRGAAREIQEVPAG